MSSSSRMVNGWIMTRRYVPRTMATLLSAEEQCHLSRRRNPSVFTGSKANGAGHRDLVEPLIVHYYCHQEETLDAFVIMLTKSLTVALSYLQFVAKYLTSFHPVEPFIF